MILYVKYSVSVDKIKMKKLTMIIRMILLTATLLLFSNTYSSYDTYISYLNQSPEYLKEWIKSLTDKEYWQTIPTTF